MQTCRQRKKISHIKIPYVPGIFCVFPQTFEEHNDKLHAWFLFFVFFPFEKQIKFCEGGKIVSLASDKREYFSCSVGFFCSSDKSEVRTPAVTNGTAYGRSARPASALYSSSRYVGHRAGAAAPLENDTEVILKGRGKWQDLQAGPWWPTGNKLCL